jgi:hypothetical protein
VRDGAKRDGGRVQGPTTFRSRLAEVFLVTAQAAFQPDAVSRWRRGASCEGRTGHSLPRTQLDF